MTKLYNFFKEDVEPEELDDHMYRMEMDWIMEQEMKKETKRKAKIMLGKVVVRHKNRKLRHGKIKEYLPF